LGVGLFVGLFTVFSMLKIWNEAFLKPSLETPEKTTIPRSYSYAILILTLWTVGLGLRPSMLSKLSDFAAVQVLETRNYLGTLKGASR